MITGHTIKMTRIAAGLRQKDIANVLGVKQQAYSKYENMAILPKWKADVLLYAIKKTAKTQLPCKGIPDPSMR